MCFSKVSLQTVLGKTFLDVDMVSNSDIQWSCSADILKPTWTFNDICHMNSSTCDQFSDLIFSTCCYRSKLILFLTLFFSDPAWQEFLAPIKSFKFEKRLFWVGLMCYGQVFSGAVLYVNLGLDGSILPNVLSDFRISLYFFTIPSTALYILLNPVRKAISMFLMFFLSSKSVSLFIFLIFFF